jgi:hypothetical protein
VGAIRWKRTRKKTNAGSISRISRTRKVTILLMA